MPYPFFKQLPYQNGYFPAYLTNSVNSCLSSLLTSDFGGFVLRVKRGIDQKKNRYATFFTIYAGKCKSVKVPIPILPAKSPYFCLYSIYYLVPLPPMFFHIFFSGHSRGGSVTDGICNLPDKLAADIATGINTCH